MKGDKNTKESRRRIFSEYLVRHNLRHTAERFLILEMIESASQPFTIERLCALLDEANTHVAPATVYAAVRLMCESGLVRPSLPRGREKRFVLVNTAPGVVCVCRSCGKSKTIRDSELDSVMAGRRIRGFCPECFSLTVYGLCTACARKLKADKQKKRQSIPKQTNIAEK